MEKVLAGILLSSSGVFQWNASDLAVSCRTFFSWVVHFKMMIE
jgi:hypothetical protein